MTPRRSRPVLPVGVSVSPVEEGREPESSRATWEAEAPAVGERVVVLAVGVWAASRRGSISAAGSGRLRWGGGAVAVAAMWLVSAAPGRCWCVAVVPWGGRPVCPGGR